MLFLTLSDIIDTYERAQLRLLLAAAELKSGAPWSKMAIAGASKMRIFTATWPPFALGVEDDRGGAGRNGVGQQGNGPQCQVRLKSDGFYLQQCRNI